MELKARVWDLDGGKMSAGIVIDNFINNDEELEFPETEETLPFNDFLFFRKEYSDWMMFTGMKDKKGKEVYHKDKLASGKKIFLVAWQKEEARFVLLPTLGNPASWKFMDECDHMEVVSNTYKDGELR